MDELLSLKWNNHELSFKYALKALRNKDTHTDVTLACDGKFYNSHKFILSTCSEYFKEIFSRTGQQQVLIVLKDITSKDFESLLDYMYIGEVNVHQDQLSSLITAAACLKIKGLAAAEDQFLKAGSDSQKRSVGEVISNDEMTTPSMVGSDASIINIKSTQAMSSTTAKPVKKRKCDNFAELKEPDFSSVFDTEDINIKEDTNYSDIVEPKSEIDENISEKIQDNLEHFQNLVRETLNNGKTLDASWSTGQNQSLLETPAADLSNSKAATPQKFPCLYCGRVFTSPWYLNRHVMIHTGEKPFKCVHCTYKANQKHSVMAHMKNIHNDFLNNPIYEGQKQPPMYSLSSQQV